MSAALKKAKNPKIDPLFIFFEQHLCNFQNDEETRGEFTTRVIQDYLAFLRRKNIAIPKQFEPAIIEELSTQVNAMLVKKIYGCLNIAEFQKQLTPSFKRRVRKKLDKIV